MCGGNVTNNGGGSVIARGVCWSTSQNPTVSGSHTTDGSGTGTFTSSITGLTAGTKYYVRAYATNSAGTAYGGQKYFTTQQSISGWLYYGSMNQHVDCWGLTLGGSTEWAVMFPTNILSQYEGTSITKIRAYLGDTGSYTLRIYRGGTYQPSILLFSQSFNVTDIGWNTIAISPLILTTTSTLWVSISCNYYLGHYPAGACAGANNPNARWWRPNGGAWMDIIEDNGGDDLCFEIQTFVTDQAKGENGFEILLPSMPVSPSSNKGVSHVSRKTQ